jgi:hypothetical protein
MAGHIKEAESRRDLPFTITAGNVTVGTFVLTPGGTWGVLFGADDCFDTTTMTIGKPGVVDYYCKKVMVPKEVTSPSSILVGAPLYFSTVNKNVSATKDVTYDKYCGVARAAAAASATTVLADIDMRFVHMTAT